jgi:hypothetical protein
MPAWFVVRCGTGWIRENDNWEFESFRPMDGHYANTLGALLYNRCFVHFASLCIFVQALHKSPERRRVVLEASGQLD